jgi:hypothetical protein
MLSEAQAQKLIDAVIVETASSRAAVANLIVGAQAAADVSRNESVQAGLIEALQSLGNKLVNTNS